MDYLDPLLAKRKSTLDHAQSAALDRLQALRDELAAFKAARQSTLKRLLSPPDVPRGLYLWGGVGRGKSFLMDSFYAVVPLRRKTRVHFHAFMRDVHEELKTLKSEVDPLATVAQRIARRYRLVCFDEFHVSDIADAMILGRLLTALFTAGVVFVMTSNYPPDELYPGGLKRENFIPTIKLLREWLDVVEVDGGVDYRLRALERVSAFHVPAGAAADAAMERAFEAMRTGPDESPHLTIEGRALHARRRAGSAVWFDFAALCDGPRSQRDYLELAQRFAVLFLSGIPVMKAEQADLARRFTWLVDILYDHRVKLVASAEAPAEALYVAGRNVFEFPRTVSRLTEMRTHDYMALPHATAGAPAPDQVPA
ncbi:MAG TPA: cell division protein ZapE [Casimicrobiaceae bacterium]|nr:cell division protein ZapE [Casimicrobiaceae bacterium]